MSKFVENVKLYLEKRNIKDNYIALLTGWDKSKVSRIMNGNADLKSEEMELLANALGRDVQFFWGDKENMSLDHGKTSQLAFFAGKLSVEEREVADKIIELFKFYDALIDM